MKIRHGGLRELEQRLLDGDVRVARALVRQACGPNTLDMRFRTTELRAVPNGTGGERLLFTGYASVVEEPFTMWDWLGDYTEIIRSGAFTKTLSESPDVIFCFNHDWSSVPMARTGAETVRLSEDSTGLHTEADLDPGRADVNILRSAMDAGEINAMSFAFYVTRQTWSPDYDQRDILEVDIDGGDVSAVTWPANPATTGTTALRAKQAQAMLRSRVPALIVQRARAEKREGKALSASTMDVLQQVLDLVAAADDAVDAAQPLLAELMGVPNPDDDESGSGTSNTDEESDSSDGSGQANGLPEGPDPAQVRKRQQLRFKHQQLANA